ncbi:MAG: metallophosphoesterase [Tissierellia bacterium]|nr:metallophosphoesterase [Tissierellia bacterium]
MIYALADTHFDGEQDKPMDIFSSCWENHQEKIRNHWVEIIRPEDWVLLAGDISWAMKLEQAEEDLRFIDSLPGKKLISRGNHDYWWASLKKMRALGLHTIDFVQNNAYSVEEYEVVGSRSWLDPQSKEFTAEDQKILDRELIRLQLSIDSAKKNRPLIAMIHYPPFNSKKEPNIIHELLKKNNVEICIYGHLHGVGHQQAVEGLVDGVEYHLTAADFIDFTPKLIRR